MPTRLAPRPGLLIFAGALLCLAPAPAPAPTPPAPTILAEPPAKPDPSASWLFYLHGRIVEEQGRNAVSPDHGPYLYDEILARLAAAGVTVISEARPRDTDPGAYADRVASQVRALAAAGVPPARITVVGASMGAWIALLVSNRLDLAGVGYVAMGICGDDTDRAFAGGLHGDVLSIFESSDPLGRSCGALLDRSPAIGRRAEIALDTGLRHGFLYRPLPEWVEPAIGWARGRAAENPEAGRPGLSGVLHLSPGDAPTALRDRLAADAGIVEVILAGGTYRGGLVIPAPRDGAATPASLLIRPAAGAQVVFEGDGRLPRLRRVRAMPGVFGSPLDPGEGEPPAIFEPEARRRYAYAADAAAVARFPGTYVVEDGRLLVHPPDGRRPHAGQLMRSLADRGLAIERPRVTVVGLTFRGFLARAKWSAGVQASADDATLLRCRAENASIGFSLSGRRAAVLGVEARDVGCGVYLTGVDGRVERCRLVKRRDGYEPPTYAQDDTGIQFYDPAHGGRILGNLVAGFGTGILIKAQRAPWRVEGNTLVGAGSGTGTGFLATRWHPDGTLRANVIAGFSRPFQWPPEADRRDAGGNCYAPWKRPSGEPVEPGSVVGDPAFSDPAAGDYRLGPASACRKAASGGLSLGAPESVAARPPGDPEAMPPVAARPADSGAAPTAASGAGDDDPSAPPRTWHVAPEGRDGADGGEGNPLRTLQEAVDRSRPGDTILAGPGIYPDSVRFTRGGVPERPITLRAAAPGTVVLDGQRRHDALVDLDGAPYVVLRDLEIRWYRLAGVRIRRSPHVTVTGCRIWNAHFRGTWPTGNGIEADQSPGLVAERNFLFAQERGLFLYQSPGAVVRRNTAVGNLYGGAQFVFSIEGSICRDNSFAFQGNDAIVIVETPDGSRHLAGADLDYNNYGMTLREPAVGEGAATPDRIAPRPKDRRLAVPSKALVYYAEQPGTAHRFASLATWRSFSGKDAHSIAADPLFVAGAARDFRLEPGSPNLGAGTGGVAIGADDGPGGAAR